MDKAIFQDIPKHDRRQYLRDNSYKVDPKYSYTRELEEVELQDRQNTLSQNLIVIDRAEQVLKEAKEIYNAEVKPLQQENKMALQQIRTRSEEVYGEVFLIKDDHNNRMGVYSPEGVLINERALLPDERQFSIISNIKEAL